jgi:hypothetical protein
VLAENYRLLSRIVIKGKKGDFTDVRRWFKVLEGLAERMVELLLEETADAPES